MDRNELYDKMAERKSAPKDFGTYIGDNGRVNRCVQMMRQGKIKTGGTLLDVGGGIGDLCFAARDLFAETFVLDISSKNLEAAKSKGCKTFLADVDKSGLPIDSETVDVVTALDFIEHIVDPENFARECRRVLRSGGEVFVNTPNIRFFKHINELWMNGTFPHTSGDKEVFHGGHLAFFTFKDLQNIFSSAGFNSFQMFKDDEGYADPDLRLIDAFKPKSQDEFVRLNVEFGSPNLLFKAVKP